MENCAHCNEELATPASEVNVRFIALPGLCERAQGRISGEKRGSTDLIWRLDPAVCVPPCVSDDALLADVAQDEDIRELLDSAGWVAGFSRKWRQGSRSVVGISRNSEAVRKPQMEAGTAAGGAPSRTGTSRWARSNGIL